jgi:hypothetical protein
VSQEITDVILHEFAYQYESDHLSREYYDALTELGAKFTNARLRRTKLLRALSRGSSGSTGRRGAPPLREARPRRSPVLALEWQAIFSHLQQVRRDCSKQIDKTGLGCIISACRSGRVKHPEYRS